MVVERVGPTGIRSEDPGALDIMLVEDHADTRRYLGMFLRQSGHRVRVAGSVDEALGLLEDDECEVLISDIGLPDGTGWELLDRIPGDGPGYAIAMSGYSLGADRDKSRKAGFREHLVKPFDLAELEKILQSAASEIDAG